MGNDIKNKTGENHISENNTQENNIQENNIQENNTQENNIQENNFHEYDVAIKVEGLSKNYKISKKQQKIQKTNEKVKKAVQNLNLEIYRGEIFGLLGPNGAGKTTTLRMLSTLIKPTSGTALIDGLDIKKEETEVRKRIGFLTSELKLEDYFTPNYLFDFFAKLYGISNEEKNKRKEEFFSKFGIDKFAEVKVGDLSTGMKQKVSLVISIIHDPEIIIFDEPTNGLDVITAKVVTDFLEELKRQKKTIILSTHIFNLVERLCDRVGIILDGKLVECDTLDKVTRGEKNGLEKRFFEIYYSQEESEAN